MAGSIGQEILRQLSEINSKVDDVNENLSEKIGDIKDELGGKEGIRERLTALEVTVASFADRETTPVSIVTTKKSSTKEQAAMVGGAGGIGAIILYILQLAGEYMKTK
jgi:hypothetical protein